jgi:hypothetical protein
MLHTRHPKMESVMAIRFPLLRIVTGALVAGIAFTFAPTTAVHADEPGVRRAAPRYHAPRYHAPRVRTVVRTRLVYVPQPVYQGCGCRQGAGYYHAAYYGGGYQGTGYYGAGYYGGGYYGGGYGRGYSGGYYHRPYRAAVPYRWAYRTARYQRHGAYRRGRH